MPCEAFATGTDSHVGLAERVHGHTAIGTSDAGIHTRLDFRNRFKQNRRRKGEYTMLFSVGMEERPLTPEQLKQLRRNLALLSEAGVENAYRDAYKDCELKAGRLPKPVAIQQLVQAWKQLWVWKKR
jgi:hypothetical protein